MRSIYRPAARNELSRVAGSLKTPLVYLLPDGAFSEGPSLLNPTMSSPTQATIVLHNYLRTTESSVYCPPGFIDSEDGDGNVVSGSWHDEPSRLTPLGPVGSHCHSRTAAAVRDAFCNYFSSSEGEVHWQFRRTN